MIASRSVSIWTSNEKSHRNVFSVAFSLSIMLPAGGKRVDTCGFYPLNSRFPLFLSLAQTRDRRPLRNRGTAEDFFYRRGAQCAPMSRAIRSAGLPYCCTDGLLCAGAAYLCRATRLRVVMDSNYEFNLITDVTAGCADLQR